MHVRYVVICLCVSYSLIMLLLPDAVTVTNGVEIVVSAAHQPQLSSERMQEVHAYRIRITNLGSPALCAALTMCFVSFVLACRECPHQVATTSLVL
jgi:hypothetical protein